MDNLISIIVPAYNVEKYIKRCLDSIIAQTYSNIEIVAIDDGSSDNTGKVLDQYEENLPGKVKVIHIPNGGVTNARLTGVANAKGEWIGFVDGDDVIEADMYEVLLKNAVSCNADISHCGYQTVLENGKKHYFYNTGNRIEQNRSEGLKDLLEGKFVEPSLCNKMFRKKLFQRLLDDELIDKEIKNNEDLLMNYYLFSDAEKSVFEDLCKYHYLVHGETVTRRELNEHKIFDPIKVKQIIVEDCDRDLKVIAESALFNTCIRSYCEIVVNAKKKFIDEKKEIRASIIEKYEYRKFLAKSTQMLVLGIVRMPAIFEYAYPLYVRYLQKKKYE